MKQDKRFKVKARFQKLFFILDYNLHDLVVLQKHMPTKDQTLTEMYFCKGLLYSCKSDLVEKGCRPLRIGLQVCASWYLSERHLKESAEVTKNLQLLLEKVAIIIIVDLLILV